LFVVLIVIALFVVFIFNPAEKIAISIIAKKSNIEPGKVTEEKALKLTLVFCVIIYALLWWILEVTGLRAIIASEF